MIRKGLLVLLSVLVLSAGIEAAETRVSAYMSVGYAFTNVSGETVNDFGMYGTVTKNNKPNYLGLDRANIQVDSKLNDVWSMRFITAVWQDYNNLDSPLLLYLKEASVTARVAPFLSISAGLIAMPEYKLIRDLNRMRWINPSLLEDTRIDNYANDGNNALTWGSNPTEAGVKTSFRFVDMIFIDLAFSTGDNPVDTWMEESTDKALSLAVHARIIEKLVIGAYGKVFVGETPGKNENAWFLGATVAWDDKFYRAGLNWTMKYYKDVFTPTFNDEIGFYSVLELYANVSLEGAINVPVIILFRAGMGMNKAVADYRAGSTDSDDSILLTGLDFTLGAGYRFNENAQVALLYQGELLDKYVGSVANADEGETFVSHILIAAEFKY
jgi:hypothetical protein